MKRALNIVLFFACLNAFAQEKKEEVYSVYFTEYSLKNLKTVSAVSSSYYKKYQPEASEENKMRNAAGEYMVVDASGIYLLKNKLLFITREQVREDRKYQVRNGYLFGVVENDSVPTALEGENYYFLIPSKNYLYNMNAGPSTLFEGLSQGEYLLVTPEENEYYSVIYFRFTNGKMEVKELIFNTDVCNVETVEEKETIK
ncbi:MAG: hypothetical protein IPM77_00860 [Crocinitomicaceae bacterium]|nr:hypothetical protein [Crocinitomicaceae bacterium]